MTDTINPFTLALCGQILAATEQPRIGEKVLADRVQAVLRTRGEDGIPTSEDRAVVAAGLIEARVRKAYKLGDPA